MRRSWFIENDHGSGCLLWRINGYSAKGDCSSASSKIYPGQAFTTRVDCLGCSLSGDLFDNVMTDLMYIYRSIIRGLLTVHPFYQYILFHLLPRLQLLYYEMVLA